MTAFRPSFAILVMCFAWGALTSSSCAQAIPIVVVSPSGCPSVGEVQAALGSDFVSVESPHAPAPSARAVLGVVEIAPNEGGIEVDVGFPGRDPATRTLPHVDCATAARLVAIVVRGVRFRDTEPDRAQADASQPEAAPEEVEDEPQDSLPSEAISLPSARQEAVLELSLGVATGLGLELMPVEGAWSGQLDLAVRWESLFLRLAFVGASPTRTLLSNGLSLERLAFGPRVDVGAVFQATDRLSLGASLGVGLIVARLSSESLRPSEFFRVSPTLGGHIFALIEFVDSLAGLMEVGADFPMTGDAYLVGESELAQSPGAAIRVLIGARITFR